MSLSLSFSLTLFIASISKQKVQKKLRIAVTRIEYFFLLFIYKDSCELKSQSVPLHTALLYSDATVEWL